MGFYLYELRLKTQQLFFGPVEEHFIFSDRSSLSDEVEGDPSYLLC